MITLAGNPNTALSRHRHRLLCHWRPTGQWWRNSGAFVYLNGGVLQVTASMTLAESSSAGTTPTSSQNRQVWIGPAGGGIDITNNSTLNLNTTIYEAGGLNGGPSAFTLTSSDFALGAGHGNGLLVLASNQYIQAQEGTNINGGTLRINVNNCLASGGNNFAAARSSHLDV